MALYTFRGHEVREFTRQVVADSLPEAWQRYNDQPHRQIVNETLLDRVDVIYAVTDEHNRVLWEPDEAT